MHPLLVTGASDGSKRHHKWVVIKEGSKLEKLKEETMSDASLKVEQQLTDKG